MKRLPGSLNHATTSPSTTPPSSSTIGCSDQKLKPTTPTSISSSARPTSNLSAGPETVSTSVLFIRPPRPQRGATLFQSPCVLRRTEWTPWQGQRESNPQPSVLETDALPVELY